MRNKKLFQCLLVITLLVAASLSCNLFTKPVNVVFGITNTAGVVVTETQGSATQAGIGGIMTESGSIMTEMGGIMTEVGGIGEIFGSDATGTPGVKPADIPVVDDAADLVGTPVSVSYTTEKNFQAVVDFYNKEMLTNGWMKVEAESRASADSADLVFTKGVRKARISILDNFLGVTVTVAIQG
jgi:hypothetical protein